MTVIKSVRKKMTTNLNANRWLVIIATFSFVFFCMTIAYPQENSNGNTRSTRTINGVQLELKYISKGKIGIQVTYVNNEKIEKRFMKPYETEEKMKYFDFFEVKFDGKNAEPLLPALDRNSTAYGEFHPPLREGKTLHPKSNFSFDVEISNIYYVPENWTTALIQIYNQHGDYYEYSGKISIKRISENSYILVSKNPDLPDRESNNASPKIDNKIEVLGEISKDSKIDIQLSFKNPSKFSDKEKGSVKIPLNKRNLVKHMSIDIDGKPAKRRQTQEDKEEQKSGTLKTDQTYKTKLDLNTWFKISEKWKKIDIKLKRFHPTLYKTDTLTIKRNQIESGEDKEEGEK